jgi:hypothetical protein
MIGFVSTLPVAAAPSALGLSAFTTSLTPARVPTVTGPTMALRVGLRRSAGTRASRFGGVADILTKADNYMARSIVMQYKKTACGSGTYGVQCTEATSSYGRSADAARVAALNARFRNLQRSPSKVYGDMFENRRQAIKGKNCHHEEVQFMNNSASAAAFVLGKAEATGSCDKYAIPESVEEAAMMRYINIQQMAKIVGGVIPSACVDGASKGAADDARVAQLASKCKCRPHCLDTNRHKQSCSPDLSLFFIRFLDVSDRNAQKPTGQLLQEKYNQVQHGLGFTNGCTYVRFAGVSHSAPLPLN